MSIRKCIYTGKEAKRKDSVMPKKSLGEHETHNWANSAPISEEYQLEKGERMPNELEMKANELFHSIELTKLRVKWYEEQLAEIQAEINKSFVTPPEKLKPKQYMSKKKAKEIKKAVHEKEVIQESEKTMDEILEKRKQTLWE